MSRPSHFRFHQCHVHHTSVSVNVTSITLQVPSMSRPSHFRFRQYHIHHTSVSGYVTSTTLLFPSMSHPSHFDHVIWGCLLTIHISLAEKMGSSIHIDAVFLTYHVIAPFTVEKRRTISDVTVLTNGGHRNRFELKNAIYRACSHQLNSFNIVPVWQLDLCSSNTLLCQRIS